MVALEGNSVMNEGLGTEGIGTLLAARQEFLDFGVGLINQAISGSTLIHMSDRGRRLDCNVMGSNSLLIANENTNSLNAYGGQVEYVHEMLSVYCTVRAKAGWKVIVVDGMDRCPPNTPDTPITTYTREQMDQYNSLIEQHWPEYAYGLIQMSKTPLGIAGAWANKDLFFDGLHPTPLGKQIITDEFMKYLRTQQFVKYYGPIVGR